MFSTLARSCLDFLRGFCEPEVLVIGSNGPSWDAAIGPEAPVWKDLRIKSTSKILGRGELRRVVALPVLERDVPQVPPRTWTLLPRPGVLDLLANKAAFATYCEQAGLERFVPSRYGDLNQVVFPAVLKRTNLNSGHGIVVVRDPADLAARLAEPKWVGQPFVLQEHVASVDDYVLHLVRAEGRITWSCTYRYPLSTEFEIRSPVEGLKVNRVTTKHGELEVAEALLRPLAYQGPANIDFRRRADGSIAVLEINPRLGGSLMRPEHRVDLGAAISAIVRYAHPTPIRTRRRCSFSIEGPGRKCSRSADQLWCDEAT